MLNHVLRFRYCPRSAAAWRTQRREQSLAPAPCSRRPLRARRIYGEVLDGIEFPIPSLPSPKTNRRALPDLRMHAEPGRLVAPRCRSGVPPQSSLLPAVPFRNDLVCRPCHRIKVTSNISSRPAGGFEEASRLESHRGRRTHQLDLPLPDPAEVMP